MKNRQEKETSSYDANTIIPYSKEAEEAVISTLLFNGNHIEWVSEIITHEAFYKPENGIIFNAIFTLYQENKPVDVITIVEQLDKMGKLSEAGGEKYLKSLAEKVVTTANLESHASYVLEKYIGRRLFNFGQDTAKKAMDESENVMDIFVNAEKEINEISNVITGKSEVKTLQELLKESQDDMYVRIENFKNQKSTGLTTGIYRLNKITGGLNKGNLIVLAARPAMGKTAVALNFTKYAGLANHKVYFMSLEMTPKELTDRMILSNTDVDGTSFRNGNIDKAAVLELNQSIEKLYHTNISFDTNSFVNTSYIRSRVREQVRKGCELVIIDYLNLIMPDVKKNRTRENEVSEITRALKSIAKESEIPIIALCQLSRKVEDRTSKKPELADLRESGSIEADADIVILAFRPGYYWEEDNMPSEYQGKKNYLELDVAKNRHGQTGIVQVRHNDSMSAIYDWDDNWEQLKNTMPSGYNTDHTHEPVKTNPF